MGVDLESRPSAKSQWGYCWTVIHVKEDSWPLTHHESFWATDLFKAAGVESEFAEHCFELHNIFQLDTIELWDASNQIAGCVLYGCVGIFFSASEHPPPRQSESMLQFKNNKQYYPLHALLSEAHALRHTALEQNAFGLFCTPSLLPITNHKAGCGAFKLRCGVSPNSLWFWPYNALLV